MGQKTTMPSPKNKTLFESLLNFQKECPNLTRNKQAFNYKYTPLEVMLSVVQPILHKNGFLLTQSMGVSENEQPVLITLLKHQSGEELKSVTLLHLTDDAKGSKGTYFDVNNYKKLSKILKKVLLDKKKNKTIPYSKLYKINKKNFKKFSLTYNKIISKLYL